jgi:hypothetical protein
MAIGNLQLSLASCPFPLQAKPIPHYKKADKNAYLTVYSIFTTIDMKMVLLGDKYFQKLQLSLY